MIQSASSMRRSQGVLKLIVDARTTRTAIAANSATRPRRAMSGVLLAVAGMSTVLDTIDSLVSGVIVVVVRVSAMIGAGGSYATMVSSGVTNDSVAVSRCSTVVATGYETTRLDAMRAS